MFFFYNSISNLNIPQYEHSSVDLEKINDSLEKISKKYKNHAVILAILNQQFGNSFSFRIIPNEEIEAKANLNEAKAFQQSDTA